MAVLARVTDFVPNTLIQSQQVDDELNQLVNLLSGVSTNKDALIKYTHATDPVLRVDQLGAGLIQQWLNNGTARASMSALGKFLLPAGIGATPSSDQISNLGTYFSDPVARATIADTNETNFSVKTVGANVLAADGDFLAILTGFTAAANGNTKRFRLYFGATAFFDTGAVAFNNVNMFVLSYLFRRGAAIFTSLTASIVTAAGAGTTVQLSDTGGQDFTVSNTLKSTGLNGTASANDMIQRGFIVIKGSI